ncbi:hypothetical protein BCF33_1579 [Hasllibacter halocynthiae]|uniref:Uncharacterized protein n=2 Tax=Hasllibacter halocynthiae TaxID=595589 RepID=A0A2T0X1F6_9RHOB|nr:hypothetical protein BCF33_1579 [Hasllibacter halocynthiae]
MEHRERRLLHGLRDVAEDRARGAFIWLHYPLVALLSWSFLPSAPEAVRPGVALFALVHLGLHLRLRNAPAHEFHGVLSWSAIGGAALFGLFYLLTVFL